MSLLFFQFSCQVLESLIRQGWEVVASPKVTTTPGFEFCTWIFRKVSTPPLHNASVCGLVVGGSDALLRVVAIKPQPQFNNAVKRALDQQHNQVRIYSSRQALCRVY